MCKQQFTNSFCLVQWNVALCLRMQLHMMETEHLDKVYTLNASGRQCLSLSNPDSRVAQILNVTPVVP